MAINPSVYVLGGAPEIRLEFFDLNGNPMVPIVAKLSIKEPSGNIITVSGGTTIPDGDLILGSGYMYYIYEPPTIGWTEYEGWGEDGMGRSVAQTAGFEVIDRVY